MFLDDRQGGVLTRLKPTKNSRFASKVSGCRSLVLGQRDGVCELTIRASSVKVGHVYEHATY